MNGHLAKLVDGFSKKYVLVVGDIMLDTYTEGEVTRISPEAPIPVLKVNSVRDVPGGAANTAHNLSALGAKVVLAGVIGNDSAGKHLVPMLVEKGIDCSCIIIDNSRPTTKKTRFVSMNQQLLRVDSETAREIDGGLARMLLSKISKHIKKADAIIISDYAKGLISERLAQAIIRLGREYKIPVIVDPKPEHYRFYRGATLIKPNYRESLEMTRERGENEDTFMGQVATKIMKELDSHILITRGQKGMTLVDKSGKIIHVPARKVDLRDVSGAGDTVTATLALSLVSGMSLIDAANLANRAAGIEVTKFGTATVLPEELKGVLREDIARNLTESIIVKQAVIDNQLGKVEEITHKIIDTYKNKKKILIFGNGGSAADAQHLAGELVGRFKIERKGFPAIALSTDSSTLTAIGNDYGFDKIFERQIEALGVKGDLAIAFTTSGNSLNILNGLKKAHELGLSTIVLTGKDGGKARQISDLCIIVPSDNTPRIQESHVALVHIICELLENEMYPKER